MVVGVGLLILYVVVTVSYSAPFLGAGAYLYLDEEDTTNVVPHHYIPVVDSHPL